MSLKYKMLWWLDNFTSVFKKGKSEDPENHRLVNLISIPGKLMD